MTLAETKTYRRDRLAEIKRADVLLHRKIGTFEDAAFLIRELELRAMHAWWTNTSGLFTGSLDVIHIGHLKLLEEAKKYIDNIFVGIDQDETLRLKGEGRPINNLAARLEMIASLDVVTMVFPIPFVLSGEYSANEINKQLFLDLTRTINPHAIITNELADPFWEEKRERANILNITYLGLKIPRPTSTTDIARKLSQL